MKKVLILALTLTLIPQVTLAAWWDPSSWFGSNNNRANTIESTPQIAPTVVTKETIREIPVEKIVNNPELLREIDDLKSQISQLKSKLNQKNKPSERIISNTISVDNPELQKKIDGLTIERDNWKLSFENALKDEAALKQRISSMNDEISAKQKEINNLDLLLKNTQEKVATFTQDQLNKAFLKYLNDQNTEK